MNKLEDLVPPLELCRKIPSGKFDDSALVWWGHHVYMRSHGDAVTPAPTLAEIMDARTRLNTCPLCEMLVNIKGEVCGLVENARGVTYFTGNKNPATAALKLWLEVNK